jgi:hypothetical protein
VKDWLGGRESEATGKITKRRLPDVYGEPLLDWIMENYEEAAQDPDFWTVYVPSVKEWVETEEERERIQARIERLQARLNELSS